MGGHIDAEGLEVESGACKEADDAGADEHGDGEVRAGAVAERPDGAEVGDELERGDDVGVVPDGPHRAVHLRHVLRRPELDRLRRLASAAAPGPDGVAVAVTVEV
uniref:Uncharacterized protein n=1 Tax=Leersia perrieri TaxID=77586 RepID=A0A0D9VV12_9ORYZ